MSISMNKMYTNNSSCSFISSIWYQLNIDFFYFFVITKSFYEIKREINLFGTY